MKIVTPVKIRKRESLQELTERYKAEGKTTVFTNGCFDILHAGHVRYLGEARHLGDCLIVGLNSDASVRRLKGPKRPVNCQEDRAEVIAALAAVDYVVIFDEMTAESIVADIRPDIYVKGGDYLLDHLPEAKIVAQYGGRTVLIPEVPGRSSTNIIRKIEEVGN
ncbi:D-glycero-beta-D-manno-heptose 1-phosphate adenylyltransferase [Acetonema longum]|uniref:D-glycero-beta-D-manno-heptose 1-phosphate adenylyltransferase n=1 Tax=Acetonema longum DSM 6540 TaxID=1009370 RepID=F7NLY4_9FIRM|nr:D-glycero-beta-D-manno-heptose 1-phosphate adenylyltransferase [Acetonema longum]EGO62910.1 rfaE bifunctional protein [Acetonema longum DSM 6540]